MIGIVAITLANSFDLGPHIKKRVIDAGLVRRKVLIPYNTVVHYHSLDDMQGMSKIKLKNLPNEWEHTAVQIPMNMRIWDIDGC